MFSRLFCDYCFKKYIVIQDFNKSIDKTEHMFYNKTRGISEYNFLVFALIF